MPEFISAEFHKGGYVSSKPNISQGFHEHTLLKSLAKEIKSIKRDINSIEGKYISLLAYYDSLVENFFEEINEI